MKSWTASLTVEYIIPDDWYQKSHFTAETHLGWALSLRPPKKKSGWTDIYRGSWNILISVNDYELFNLRKYIIQYKEY